MALCLGMILLCSCKDGTEERRSSRGEHFVPDPNYLYFKNTRARDYRTEELADKTILWKLDDLFSSDAVLQPVIQDVWLEDRAYLTCYLRGEPSQAFRLEAERREDAGWEFVPVSDPMTLAQIHAFRQMLGAQRALRVITPSDTLGVFSAPPERAAAREVIDDYLRLLE